MKWISVLESLPPDPEMDILAKDYLVLRNDNRKSVFWPVISPYFGSPRTYAWGEGHVTHWMDIPQLPEKKE